MLHWTDPVIRTNAFYTSLMVGTVLVLINQGQNLLRGAIHFWLVFKLILTYAVPYLVASFSAVRSQLRLKPHQTAAVDGDYRCERCLEQNTVEEVHLKQGESVPECQSRKADTEFTLYRRHR